MAYTPVSFVADEILTSTKMNQLAANDASFNDGTGIGNGTILPSKLSSDLQNAVKQPYIASTSARKTNTEAFSMTAPNSKSGYKFLCWIYVTTLGAVASWSAEVPTSQTTTFWFCFSGDGNFNGTVVGYALYVPNA